MALAASAAMALVLGACHNDATITGGGWMFSASGAPDKATFSFEVVCDADTDTISGEWVYKDRTPGGGFAPVYLAGALSEGTDCPDDPQSGGSVHLSSPYIDRRCGPACGSGVAVIEATDTNKRGSPKGDSVALELFGGPFSGYANSGVVQGGNITISR